MRVRKGIEGTEAGEGDVGGELGEIFGIGGAELGVVSGERPRDGFDFAEDERRKIVT